MAEPPPRANLPRYLYRVQHKDSRTIQNELGFSSREGLNPWALRDYSKVITFERLVQHLNWRTRSPPHNHFISMFDDRDEAHAYAEWHRDEWHHELVNVTRIDTEKLSEDELRLDCGSQILILPIWRGPRGEIFFSTLDAWGYLGLPTNVGQLSEWFAVYFISAEMIDDVYYLPQTSTHRE